MFIGTPCITYVGSNNLSLKYQRFTLKGCNVIGIRNYGFVAKVQLNSFNQFYLRNSQHFLYSSSIRGVIILFNVRWLLSCVSCYVELRKGGFWRKSLSGFCRWQHFPSSWGLKLARCSFEILRSTATKKRVCNDKYFALLLKLYYMHQYKCI